LEPRCTTADMKVQVKRPRIEEKNYVCHLGPEAAAKVLSMVFLQDVLTLSGCNWQLRCWLSPSETILKLLDVTLPADHVLKNMLLMAGASGFLSLQVLKEIRHWVCQSTLRLTDFKPVTRWSIGQAREALHEQRMQRLRMYSYGVADYSMEEAVKIASLSSKSCAAMVHQVMRQTSFTCSPALSEKIRDLTDSIPNSFQWPCCNFGSISSTYELHGGRASGGCSDESLTVILKKDDMLIRMDASYLCFDVQGSYILSEGSRIVCHATMRDMRNEPIFEISNFLEAPNRDMQPAIQTNVKMLKMLGIELLGQEVEMSLTLHLLWRLLCAPLVIWPFKTQSDFCDSLTSSNHVMSDLQLPGSPGDREWIPVILHARSMFEKVAHHIHGKHVDPTNPVDPISVRVSSSTFDDKTFLDQLVKIFKA